MFIKKILETYIDISNPNDIFTSDVNGMLLRKLNDKFVGRCYMSCLIVDIIRIVKRSCIYMKKTLHGDCHVNMVF